MERDFWRVPVWNRWIGGLGVAEPVHNTRASASLILPFTKLFVVETI